MVKPVAILRFINGVGNTQPVDATINDQPVVLLNEVGVRGGWATWPIDFDPTWVEQCLLFEKKEEV